MKGIGVGIIGLGTVGTGVAKILLGNARIIEQRLGQPVILKKVADLDIERDRGVDIDRAIMTCNADDLLDDPEIAIVVELIGGYEPALSYIIKAIKNGKHVVTANKALLAQNGEALFNAAAEYGVNLGFEASVGGGIPIIRAIKEGFAANRIESIYGIINGTSNYILSKMTDEGRGFKEVLKETQKKGYAEADPSFDIDGIDSAHKIVILASLAFGARISLKDVYIEGIRGISTLDISYAKELGYRVKLLAIAKLCNGEIDIRVHPTMLPEGNIISNVNGVLNAISVVADAAGPNMFIGQGAGSMPTGSAVVSDVIEMARGIAFGVKGQRVPPRSYPEHNITQIKIRDKNDVEAEYYLRFYVLDKPGVLSKISGILGKNDISISSVIQKERREGKGVPLVMMTHHAREQNVLTALSEVDRLDVVLDETILIRVEKGE